MDCKTRNISYEEILKKLECPFNWNFGHVDKSIRICDYSDSDKDYLPLLNLMSDIAILYVWIKEKEPLTVIEKRLIACEDNMTALKKKNDLEISTEVANHILQATKCFLFFEFGKIEKMRQILPNIPSVRASDKKEQGTLKACKSIICFKGKPCGYSEAEKCIRGAIEDNPDCHLWHYLLGRILRKTRRSTVLFTRPDNEEIECFLKAYKKSKNPIYGVFLAHVYRETGNYEGALQMYEDIFNSELESNTIILRIALGFMQLRNFDRAKECLDKADKISTSLSMYYHYRGMYHLKQKQYEKALEFFEEAIKDDNLSAEEQYLQCKVKVDITFNVTAYLLKLYDKYKDLPKSQQQRIVLQIAYSYYRIDHQIEEALKYFLIAIKMDPNARCLTNFYSCNVKMMNCKNVFRYLKNDVLRRFKLYQRYRKFDKDTVDTVEKLQQCCHEYFGCDH